jgi:hypothetical protein
MVAEWSKSMSTEATLVKFVTADVMAKVVIGGWRTSDGESYPDPCPSKIVVFEDFYWCGFGNPCHPFLHKLCDYYRINICNLHPNSVLSVSVYHPLRVASQHPAPLQSAATLFLPEEERRCGRVQGSRGSLPEPS